MPTAAVPSADVTASIAATASADSAAAAPYGSTEAEGCPAAGRAAFKFRSPTAAEVSCAKNGKVQGTWAMRHVAKNMRETLPKASRPGSTRTGVYGSDGGDSSATQRRLPGLMLRPFSSSLQASWLVPQHRLIPQLLRRTGLPKLRVVLLRVGLRSSSGHQLPRKCPVQKTERYRAHGQCGAWPKTCVRRYRKPHGRGPPDRCLRQ
eukprot:COSAG02_NODE_4337_length_5487_cov_3.358575_4_plen_206_part_00